MSVSISQHDDDFSTFTVCLNDDNYILTTLTSSGADVESWLDTIYHIHRRRLHNLCVGVDVEWRPNRGGYENPVALLQLCVGRRCLLFHILHADYVPTDLHNFLSDARFRFFGVGIDEDAEKLACDYDLSVRNTVDLRELAFQKTGREDLKRAGLKGLANAVMGIDVLKPRRVTMSRWDCELNLDQIQYACVDAFLSFEIGRRLSSGYY